MDAALGRVKSRFETFFGEVGGTVETARPGVQHRVGYHETQVFPLSIYLTLSRSRSTDEDVVLIWRFQRLNDNWRVTADVLRENGTVIAAHGPVEGTLGQLSDELPRIVDDCVRFFRERLPELPELVDQIPM